MSTFSTQLLIAVGGLSLYILLTRWNAARTSGLRSLPRAPGGHWLWGHEKEAWQTPDARFYLDNFEKNGQSFVMKGGLFHPAILALADPAAISHMYTKHPYQYIKSSVIRPLVERLMGRSIVWAEGDLHKRQRQTLNPVFTHENVKRMDGEIYNASHNLVNSLKEHIVKGNPDADELSAVAKVNILDWTASATLDIIGAVGFGHDFQAGSSPAAVAIKKAFRELVWHGMTVPGFVSALVMRAFPFIVDLPIEAIQAQGEIKTIIKNLGRKMVEDRKVLDAAGEIRGKDMLSTLLRMQDVHGESVEDLLDHICTFVLVGYETTATVLNFTLYSLAQNPEIQSKLRQELLDFKSSSGGNEPTYEDFQSRLPYLDAVTKEGLRVWPVGSHTERVAQQDDVLPLRFPVKDPRTGDDVRSIHIKKGQVINISSIAINRSKSVWGPDADQFRPERWMSKSSIPNPADVSQGWNGLFSFSEGPRICIGLRLALFEFKVILSELIKAFEFLPVEGPDGRIQTMFSSAIQPFVVGRLEEGTALPLNIRCAQI